MSVENNGLLVADFEMPAGYIKIEKSIPEVQREVEEKFKPAQFHELIDERQKLPSRFKILCVFLYTMISQKKLNVIKSSRNFAKVRQQEVANYDRFVVLGVAGSSSVMLSFTPTSDDSKRLLGWYKLLRPGMPVWLLSPKVVGFLKARMLSCFFLQVLCCFCFCIYYDFFLSLCKVLKYLLIFTLRIILFPFLTYIVKRYIAFSLWCYI